MSKFINTTYKSTVNSIVDSLKIKLDNTFYNFIDKKPTLVTYYNQSEERTTLDEASKLNYAALGKESPLRFNKILDACVYGIERIIVDLDMGDFGLESNAIEGEAIIIPNSFIPYPDDYFCIDYANKVILFRVMSASIDTLDNGANFYKLSYKLDQYDYSENTLDSQVVETFRMVTNNIGTNYKTVLKSTDYDLVENIDNLLIRLKTYYSNLFFNSKVQTFSYCYNNVYFYDPYLIEFLRRNRILEGGDEYIYVDHQMVTHKTFYLDYDRTFFRSVELKNKEKINDNKAYGLLINDPNSLLSTRLEDYYAITYGMNNGFCAEVPIIDDTLVSNIKSNTLYESTDANYFYNIIINYFNDIDMKDDLLFICDNIDFNSNISLFYMIPIIIYILENSAKKLLSK